MNKIQKTIKDFYEEVEREEKKKERALARKLRRKGVKGEAKANTKTIQKNGYNSEPAGRKGSFGNSNNKNKIIPCEKQGRKSKNRKGGGVKTALGKD